MDHNHHNNIFTLPPIGRMGRRRIDRLFMEQVNSRTRQIRRAARIRRASNDVEKQETPPLVELAMRDRV